MPDAGLEHVNITVSDIDRTADMLCSLFGWHVRWRGAAIHNGESLHVGSDTDYIAIYRGPNSQQAAGDSYNARGGMNHIGITVDDIDAIERRVIEAGFEPHSHADYEPGRRFYFRDGDGIEFEVVSYT
ncbi:VOC family protein [Rhodobacteraceae bacterium NNCM2]|nr:VOC family protein [Coraliihabitans acroporae]